MATTTSPKKPAIYLIDQFILFYSIWVNDDGCWAAAASGTKRLQTQGANQYLGNRKKTESTNNQKVVKRKQEKDLVLIIDAPFANIINHQKEKVLRRKREHVFYR